MDDCRPNPDDRTFWTAKLTYPDSEDSDCTGIGDCIIELNFIVQ